MIEARTAVNVTLAVREWCRSRGFVAFTGVNNNGSFPQVIVQRIAGPDDDVLFQFDVWAADGGGARQAEDEAARLASELTGLTTYIYDGCRLLDARWSGTRWLPDPVSDRPRFVVEAVFFATAL
jgi:hypothetical protein